MKPKCKKVTEYWLAFYVNSDGPPLPLLSMWQYGNHRHDQDGNLSHGLSTGAKKLLHLSKWAVYATGF
jgi:hypothetical protein